ncbi:M23 family metallopeptidase [Nocardioides sp. JQ2195]|uniref:M23 family metallopeptidase n=1 Tax=Nocardioides sp. JQ2195 TaxID=2592334 RepID=UPI00143E7BF6|nr:M23 family metallopeptidase [Nocardioides sp. JQ2195]QIX26736.1 M23 family metallopeptidase [Nocardioides sp. JQ2195]
MRMPLHSHLRRSLVGSAALGIILSTSSLSVTAQAASDGKAPARPKTVASAVTIEPLPQWVLPVSGYHLTGTFGASSSLWSTTHTGLDFAAPLGTPIVSVTDGVVTEAAYDGAYGYRTVIRMADGTELWYCHQNSLQTAVGETVGAGEVIGEVGATGNVTGPHLHLEVRPTPDVPVDPYATLVEHGLQP